jgi:hypothetical protein
LAKLRFRECGKANAYSANSDFTVSAHGEHIRGRKAPTENSNIIIFFEDRMKARFRVPSFITKPVRNSTN